MMIWIIRCVRFRSGCWIEIIIGNKCVKQCRRRGWQFWVRLQIYCREEPNRCTHHVQIFRIRDTEEGGRIHKVIRMIRSYSFCNKFTLEAWRPRKDCEGSDALVSGHQFTKWSYCPHVWQNLRPSDLMIAFPQRIGFGAMVINSWKIFWCMLAHKRNSLVEWS